MRTKSSCVQAEIRVAAGSPDKEPSGMGINHSGRVLWCGCGARQGCVPPFSKLVLICFIHRGSSDGTTILCIVGAALHGSK